MTSARVHVGPVLFPRVRIPREHYKSRVDDADVSHLLFKYERCRDKRWT